MDSCLRAVCSLDAWLSQAQPPARAPPQILTPPPRSAPFPRGRSLGEPCFRPASGSYLFCSLAAEEVGLEDSPDSGWRLCLRLHGPLHPEGLSPDGHELPFLFEQVRISSIKASQKTPNLNPPFLGQLI